MQTTMIIGPAAALKDNTAYGPAHSAWPLIGTTAIMLLLFWYSGHVLQWLQPTAAVVDAGTLSLLLLALLGLVVFTAISHLLTGLLWPVFRDYRKYHFTKNFKTLLPWQKIAFYMAAFFLLLYAFVGCLLALF